MWPSTWLVSGDTSCCCSQVRMFLRSYLQRLVKTIEEPLWALWQAKGRIVRVTVGSDNGIFHELTLERHVAQLDCKNGY